MTKEIREQSVLELSGRMLEAGFTLNEIEAWDRVRVAANAVLALPEQHGMEREEACHAFHQIQNYLLSRAAMRNVLGY